MNPAAREDGRMRGRRNPQLTMLAFIVAQIVNYTARIVYYRRHS